MRKMTTATTIAGAFLALMLIGTPNARADEGPFGGIPDWQIDTCTAFGTGCEFEVPPIDGGSPGTVIAPELPDETTDALEAPIVDVFPLAPLPPERVVLVEDDDSMTERIEEPTRTEASEAASGMESDTDSAGEATTETQTMSDTGAAPEPDDESTSGETTSSEATESDRSDDRESAPTGGRNVSIETEATSDSGAIDGEEVGSEPVEVDGTLADTVGETEEAIADPVATIGASPLLYAALVALAIALLGGAIGAGFAIGRRSN